MHGVPSIHNCTPKSNRYRKSRWATIRAESSTANPAAVRIMTATIPGSSTAVHPGGLP